MSDNLSPVPLHFSQAPVEGRGRGFGVGRHLGAISPVCFGETSFAAAAGVGQGSIGVRPFGILDGWTILLLLVKLIAIWGIACYQVIVLPANHTGSGACCSSSLLILSTSFAERA